MPRSRFSAPSEVSNGINRVLERTRVVADSTTVIFVTNLREGAPFDVYDGGISNSVQYYTLDQADTIIRSIQDAGFHVLSFFSETEFMQFAMSADFHGKTLANRVVFTAAEGGTGAGRRALIPSFCRLLDLPYCNSGPHGCSVARHKFHSNAILQRAGVRAPETWLYHGNRGWIGAGRPQAGTRVIVKPTYESMAIGIDEGSVCFVDEGLDTFLMQRALRFGQPVTIQEFIVGREIGVPIIELERVEALPPIEWLKDGFQPLSDQPRTFVQQNLDKRYVGKPIRDVPEDLRLVASEAAVMAFEALDMAGAGRIDMRLDEDGRAWVFDTNESPPPLATTSYARSLATLGFNISDMLSLWVGGALHRAGRLPV